MTKSDTITCPECGDSQPRSAPYCQNCGFRMRPAETMREALQPLQREKLKEYLHRSEDDDIDTQQRTKRPLRQMINAEETEVEAVTVDADHSVKPGLLPSAAQASNTLVEGVRAVEKPTVAVEALDLGGTSAEADESQESPQAPDGRVRPSVTALESRSKTLAIVLSTVVVCAMAMGFLTWVYLYSSPANQDDAAVSVLPRVIEIQEGPFRKGLSDESQSFIMQICQRIHDGPSSDCERDQLLAGEYPQQTVLMPQFSIDSGPVRNKEYQACVSEGACAEPDWEACDIWTPAGLQIGVRMPRTLQRSERPVVCVDRSQAREYCRWRGGDLPTHNQWEKAARGRQGLLFPWGDFWDVDLANYGERDLMRISVAGKLDGFAWTSPVGAYPRGRSPFELDDMAGNVAEWVRGDDELDGHVRGGSWISAPFELRTTARVARDVASKRTDIGFRCVY